jgi:CHAD domain-containing protein
MKLSYEVSAQSQNISFNINLNRYQNSTKRNISRVSNRLDDYLQDPNEENIHDIRTAGRRLEASYRSLPGNIRNKNKIKKYVKQSKDLFRINSRIRDYDIIAEKLRQYSDGNVEKMPQARLQNMRKKKLEEAKVLAVALRKMKLPKLKQSKISERKLNKRYNKVVDKFASRIEMNYPVVITNSDKITELHEMRKDCKKLRYLLELLGPNNANLKNVSQLIEELEKTQDMLGAIHDYDTVVAYLKHQPRNRAIEGIVHNIVGERKKRYDEFRNYSKANLSHTNNNFFLNIWKIV